MISAIRRSNGEIRFNPHADEPIRCGDYLIVMGDPSQMGKLEDLAAHIVVST